MIEKLVHIHKLNKLCSFNFITPVIKHVVLNLKLCVKKKTEINHFQLKVIYKTYIVWISYLN